MRVGSKLRWRKMTLAHLEDHPNLDEILGILAQLPHIEDRQIPMLARRWRNTAAIADARSKALSPDSPLVIEVLSCFEGLVALFEDDLAGEADYVTVPVSVTTTALKAVRDAIAAAYARPTLSQGEYLSLMRPWREVFTARPYAEPDLGPSSAELRDLLTTLPVLSARCHDADGQRMYDALCRAASTMDEALRQTARDEAWRAAILTSRRRIWAMVRRSGTEALTRACPTCHPLPASSGTRGDVDLASRVDERVQELCLDAACGLLVTDAMDETLTDILVLPLRQLIPAPRPSSDGPR